MFGTHSTSRFKTILSGWNRIKNRSGRAERIAASAVKAVAESLESRMLLSASATMVADINQSTADSNVSLLASLGNGKVVFFASDGFHGAEPFVTDGTAAGTMLLKDVNPGPASSTPRVSIAASDYQTAVVANGRLFFQADDGVDGYELWATDGTPGGTTLVKDIWPGIGDSNPTQMVAVGNTVFFVASDGTNGTQLWKSDGTTAGTSMVTTIGTLSSPGLQLGTAFNGRIFFTADDGVHGNELWSSDGTAAGTAMVADINPGQASSDPVELTVSGSQLFFTTEDGTTASKLWVTDGTSAGTHLAADLGPGGAYLNLRLLTDVNGTLFFENWNGSGLYKSDGTSAGTVLVHSFNSSGAIDNMINYGGRDYLVANDGVTGDELWQSDGTTAGTTQVADLAPGPASALPYSGGPLTVAGSNLYFAANAGGGEQLYVITAVGGAPTAISPTGSVELGNYLGNPPHFAAVGSSVYFNGFSLTAGAELWHSDGTAAGTGMVADINNAITIGSNPSTLTEINGHGVFAANDSIHGIELWVTDGSAGGTTLLKDIVPGPGDGLARGPIGPSFIPAQLGNYFYFAAGVGDGQVWRTDGTTAGTTLCLSFTAGSTTNGYGGVSQLTSVNGSLYFFADDGSGMALYVSDGTTSGTKKLHGLLLPPSLNDYQPAATEFSAVGNRVVFAATDSTHGTEPWVTDGTPAGTMLLDDVYTGTYSSLQTEFYGLQRFASLGSAAYFVAQSLSGLALWRTDGTIAGTSLVKNFTAINVAGVAELTPFNGSLYFSTYVGLSSTQGGDLWTSDGTASGTVLVESFPSSKFRSAPSNLTVVGNTLFFFAPPSPSSSPEGLFASDGTAAGTILVPGTGTSQVGSSPFNLINVQGTLYFTDNQAGVSELWRVDQSPQTGMSVEDIWPAGPAAVAPNPSNLVGLDGTLFFQASDQTHGGELWKLNLLHADAGGPYLSTGAIQLDASGSRDPNPSYPLTYSWDLDGDGIFGETGSTAYLGNETGVKPTYYANQVYPGVYPVNLRVTGSWQNTATATSYVTIPPLPHFAGDTVTFDAISNAFTQSWTIDWGDGTPVENYTGNSSSISHLFATASGASPFMVQFTAVGTNGAIEPLAMPVTIYADPVLNNGVLYLTGTSGSDDAVAASAGGEFFVGLNRANREYNSSLITRFVYNDGGGDDQIGLRDFFLATLNLSTGNYSIDNIGATAIVNLGTGKISRLDADYGSSTTFAASNGLGIRQIQLSALNIFEGGKVVFANSSSTLGDYSHHANRNVAVIDAGGLNIATGGILDMGDNDLILHYLSANETAARNLVSGLLANGFDRGAFDTAGINSSEASYDANFGSGTRALGWMDNIDIGATTFDGVNTSDLNEVMIKFTYYGDSDLSGTVDATDFGLFAAGKSNAGTGWAFGNYDYDSTTADATDFGLFAAGNSGYKQFGGL